MFISRSALSRLATTGALVAGILAVGGITSQATAHECTTDPETGQEECHDTPVYDNWRPNYIPLFGLRDRDNPETRKEAQRWRDEHGCDNQHCTWADHNTSVDDGTPTSVHAGTAADHSMFEVAHDSEEHGSGEGNHDAHGGAIYADICVGSDAGTSYEGQAGACTGPTDTKVGIVIMDHLTCPYGCADEYHEVRPLQPDYTVGQMEDSQAEIGAIVSDPRTYICGYPEHSRCPLP